MILRLFGLVQYFERLNVDKDILSEVIPPSPLIILLMLLLSTTPFIRCLLYGFLPEVWHRLMTVLYINIGFD